MKKVQRGQRMQIPASDYNALIEAAEQMQRGGNRNNGAAPPAVNMGPGEILVKNDSGRALGLFAAIRLADVYVRPETNEAGFAFGLQCYSAVIFDRDYRNGDAVAVLLQPLTPNAVGRARLSGVVPVVISNAAADGSTRFAVPQNAANGAFPVFKAADSGISVIWAQGARPGYGLLQLGAAAAAASGYDGYFKLAYSESAETNENGETTIRRIISVSGIPEARAFGRALTFGKWLPAEERMLDVTGFDGFASVYLQWQYGRAALIAEPGSAYPSGNTVLHPRFLLGWVSADGVVEQENFRNSPFIFNNTSMYYNGQPLAQPVTGSDGSGMLRIPAMLTDLPQYVEADTSAQAVIVPELTVPEAGAIGKYLFAVGTMDAVGVYSAQYALRDSPTTPDFGVYVGRIGYDLGHVGNRLEFGARYYI